MTEARYAGFWIRLVADIIDTVILMAVAWVGEVGVLGIVYLLQSRSTPFSDTFNPFMTQVLGLVLYGIAAMVYYTYGHYRYGTTLGKLPLQIFVVSEKNGVPLKLKQSVIRTLAYALSGLPLCAGFLMAAVHPEKRALHDLVAGTISVRKKRLE